MWVVGWLVGWLDGWIDGWVDGSIVRRQTGVHENVKYSHRFLSWTSVLRFSNWPDKRFDIIFLSLLVRLFR